MRKLLYSLVLIALLFGNVSLTTAAAKKKAPTLSKKAFTNGEYAFSIRLPEGWKSTGPALPGVPYFSFIASDVVGNVARVPALNIQILPSATSDIKVAVQSVKDLVRPMQKQRGETEKITKERYPKLSGLKVYISQSRVTTKLKTATFRDTNLIAVKDGVAYLIGARVLEKDWKRYSKVLDQSLRSFRIDTTSK